MRFVAFTAAARSELLAAQDWYEGESPGLGDRFLSHVDDVLERLTTNPFQFPALERTARRALIHRFPYSLIFTVEPDDSLLVIACFHSSRNPHHWRSRI